MTHAANPDVDPTIPGRAVAGLLKYRNTVPESRALAQEQLQQDLFPNSKNRGSTAKPKYRRQSLHLSETCDEVYRIPWNKSFDPASVIYRATTGNLVIGYEELPNSAGRNGRIEAVIAPYQRDDAHLECGDVLFFWEESKVL